MNRRVLNPDVRQHIPALDMYQPYPQLDNPPTPDVPPCITSASLLQFDAVSESLD